MIRYVPALLWSAFIFVLCFIPGSDIPKQDWLDKIYFDKIAHAFLYFVFYFLLQRAVKKKAHGILIMPFSICIAQGILIECLQGSPLIQERSFDVWDIAANLAGTLLAIFWTKRRA